MPTLDFKGKRHIYAHYLTVPYRPLVPEPDKSVGDCPDDDECGEVSLDNGNTKGRFRIVFREESFAEVMA